VYVIVDDHSCTEYTRPLHLKLAVEVLKVFMVEAENDSEKRIWEIMMDNTHELSMGKMCDICGCNRPTYTPVPHHPAPDGVAE